MRIRKRFPPPPPATPPSSFPLSSSSQPAAPAAVLVSSDPQLSWNRPSACPRPLIQPNSHDENRLLVVQNKQPAKSDDSPPNQEVMIGSANPRWGFLTRIGKETKIEDDGWKEEEEEKRMSCNDARKESIGAELNSSSMHLLSQTSSSSRVGAGGWDEEDKTLLPLKKRKGISSESVIIATSTEAAATLKEKMKSKTNKKCLSRNSHHQKEGIKESTDEEEIIKHVDNGISGKKNKRGSVIMEGSRCSRVNGRGWRCCQQTLVGYSLCEHHLGKGRLRSMISVRNRGMASRGIHHHQQIGARDEDHPIAPPQGICKDITDGTDEAHDVDVDDDEKKKPLVKKRMKLGVVKARSISSLLGQTDVDNRVPAADNDGEKDEHCHV